jgi:serine/threonine protein kinase
MRQQSSHPPHEMSTPAFFVNLPGQVSLFHPTAQLKSTRSYALCARRRTRMSISTNLIDFAGAGDFEIRRYIGSLGFKTIIDWEYYSKNVSPLAATRTVEAQAPQVRLYEARCIAANPRLYNARVLLKEFLPDGMELAVNEAEAYKLLYESKGERVYPNAIPIATLLGSFLTDESFDQVSLAEVWATRFPTAPEPPKPGTPFLVFLWEGNLTAGQFPAAVARGTSPGGRLFDSLWPQASRKRIESFMVTLLYKALQALLYLHSAGLVHRSIGTSSLMVNTVDDRMASNLEVKLRDFGFCKPTSALIGGYDLTRARKAGASAPSEISNFFFSEDIYSLGYTFCELVFSSLVALSPGSSFPDASQDRFKKTFEDTFDLDVESFRDYCIAEDAWAPAIAFLDRADRAGWMLLRDMLQAKAKFSEVSLIDLLGSPLFAGRDRR